jgi:hypothetical protein
MASWGSDRVRSDDELAIRAGRTTLHDDAPAPPADPIAFLGE